MIERIQTRYQDASSPPALRPILEHWPRIATKALPKGTATAPKVAARVHRGRWLADCPFCTGAELVDPDDPRFFCMTCDNGTAEGRFLKVVFPRELKEIEAELSRRNSPVNRNWFPHEKLADLKKETDVMQGSL